MNTVWLVIPCYNEESVLPETANKLKSIVCNLISANKISSSSKIALINDGSKDSTWKIIEELHKKDKLFTGINLSRNRGHQNALLAGLDVAINHADAVISLDADLQDDINAIEQFINKYNEGFDIVYGVRSSRKTDTLFKRFSAEGFYNFMKLLGVDIVFNHADYRLMSKRAIEALQSFKEVNIFLRGIVPQIGYPSTVVEYERNKRFAGESKYPLRKMLSFAFEGVTSFSIRPIRIITTLGMITCLISIIMLIYFFITHYIGNAVSGWSSIVVSIWALGGLQLFALGIIGEYIGKIYLETKNRPKFIIEGILYDE